MSRTPKADTLLFGSRESRAVLLLLAFEIAGRDRAVRECSREGAEFRPPAPRSPGEERPGAWKLQSHSSQVLEHIALTPQRWRS